NVDTSGGRVPMDQSLINFRLLEELEKSEIPAEEHFNDTTLDELSRFDLAMRTGIDYIPLPEQTHLYQKADTPLIEALAKRAPADGSQVPATRIVRKNGWLFWMDGENVVKAEEIANIPEEADSDG